MSDAELLSRVYARLGDAVERVTVQVRGEQVLLFVRDSSLRTLCTCGVGDCGHLHDALSWVLGEHEPQDAEARVRSSLRPPHPPFTTSDLVLPSSLAELASALEDVLLAVVRTGVTASGSPSVRETLARVLERAPSPVPPGIARWVGRLGASLAEQDLGVVARLLDGAARFAEDLRATDPNAEQLARCNAWLGSRMHVAIPPERITDRVFLEVGRERLTGLSRRSLEHRYLVDLQSGELFCEQRLASGEASLGPCPRVLQVGLAEAELGGCPRRVRLLQYAVSPQVTAAHWQALDGCVVRSVQAITETYVSALRQYPGQAEPVVLFAPAELSAAPLHEPQDQAGDRLPLARAESAALVEAVQRVGADREVAWLAGRVTDAAGILLLRPVSMAVRSEGAAALSLRRVA